MTEAKESSAVPEPAETATVTEPRKLGLVGKALVGLMVVVTAGLGVGAVVVMRARRIEEEKRRATQVVLLEVRPLVQFNLRPPPDDPVLCFEGVGCPSLATDEPDEVTGQVRLRRDSCRDTSLDIWECGFPTEQWMLQRGAKTLYLNASCKKIIMQKGTDTVRWSGRQVVLDAWGNPIYYRCPGPIHKDGWDLISCGPNGVFENGGGDDIVVGEDLPGGLAAISSESGTATGSK